jgi:hypothetical protein
MTVTASNFERKANDLYETEAWATHALAKHLPPLEGMVVWEPAAGNHKIADVLREYGCKVRTSDITTYASEHDEIRDFLVHPYGGRAVNAIITNPPYGKGNRDAVKFADNSLKFCDGWIALLLTAKFDFGKTRRFLFEDNDRFAFKVALLDRIQWFEGATSGTEDHAWYVWRPSADPVQAPRLLYGARA